jgi:hypothetical protein
LQACSAIKVPNKQIHLCTSGEGKHLNLQVILIKLGIQDCGAISGF